MRVLHPGCFYGQTSPSFLGITFFNVFAYRHIDCIEMLISGRNLFAELNGEITRSSISFHLAFHLFFKALRRVRHDVTFSLFCGQSPVQVTQ